MSGGAFNHAYAHIKYLAADLEEEIQSNDSNFSDKTLAVFTSMVDRFYKDAQLARAAEWLVSGDDSEDTFHDHVNKIMVR